MFYVPTETRSIYDGSQRIYTFPNGYSASIICHQYSYGGPEGLYEGAVMDQNGDLCYDTPVTDNVVGYMTMNDVEQFLDQIAQL